MTARSVRRDDAIVVHDAMGDSVVPRDRRDRAGRGRRVGGSAAAIVIETKPRRRGTRTWHVDPLSLTPTDDDLRAAKPGPLARKRDTTARVSRARA